MPTFLGASASCPVVTLSLSRKALLSGVALRDREGKHWAKRRYILLFSLLHCNCYGSHSKRSLQ